MPLHIPMPGTTMLPDEKGNAHPLSRRWRTRFRHTMRCHRLGGTCMTFGSDAVGMQGLVAARATSREDFNVATSWTGGYMAEINYTYGFYRELTPAMLQFAMLAAGMRAPSFAQPRTYCELGCGQGLTANLLAAANPHIDFHATDFNPGQIAGAQDLAAAAGTPNIRFYEDSFAEFAARSDLPDFDAISLHGIYSWISTENRHVIVDFIRKRLKPGGVVYISYNALPGWSAAAPLRRLFVDHAATHGGAALNRIEQALTFAEGLDKMDARYFRANPGMSERLDKVKGLQRAYLLHEYMNKDWTPFYHSDVAGELAEAKLAFAANATILEQIDAINLTGDQQQFLAGIPDISYRETLRDYIINQQFRRDIFAKGVFPLRQTEVLGVWEEFSFVLSVDLTDVPRAVKGNLGEGNLQPEIYDPIKARLASGPVTWTDLVQTPEIAALGFPRIMQAMAILIGSNVVQPCLPGDMAARRSQTDAFNLAVMERARLSSDIVYLASPVTGGGIPTDHVTLLFLLARRNSVTDLPAFVFDILVRNNQRLVREGKTLQAEAENMEELQKRLISFKNIQVPIFERLGIV